MDNQRLDALFTGLTGSSANSKNSKGLLGNNNHNNNTSNTGNSDNNGNGVNSKNTDEIRFCTIVDSHTLHKIRLIANREGLLIKDVVGAAFTKAIKSYESKHGTVEGDLRTKVDNLF